MSLPKTVRVETRIRNLVNEGGLKNKQIARALAEDYPGVTPEDVAVVVKRMRRRKAGGILGRRHTALPIVADALELARQIGVKPAAEKLKIHRKTLQRWRTKFGADYRLEAA